MDVENVVVRRKLGQSDPKMARPDKEDGDSTRVVHFSHTCSLDDSYMPQLWISYNHTLIGVWVRKWCLVLGKGFCCLHVEYFLPHLSHFFHDLDSTTQKIIHFWSCEGSWALPVPTANYLVWYITEIVDAKQNIYPLNNELPTPSLCFFFHWIFPAENTYVTPDYLCYRSVFHCFFVRSRE